MKLHSQQFGTTGPDIVLIHGWGWHAGAWDDIASDLAKAHRVWTVDLPGHGRSRTDGDPRTLDDLARAIGACVPAGATWVGWSLGGMAALSGAQLGLARRLVLVATTPCFLQAQGWEWGWMPAALAQFAAEVEADAERALERFASLHLGGEKQRGLLRRLRAEIRRGGGAPARGSGLGMLGASDLRALLPEIRTPARVLHGTADSIVPWQAGARLAAALANAEFVSIAQAGHGLPLSHAEVLAHAIEDFIRG
jgi:pimeloyl-[acyl-carrier protein] methyl ester esterase